MKLGNTFLASALATITACSSDLPVENRSAADAGVSQFDGQIKTGGDGSTEQIDGSETKKDTEKQKVTPVITTCQVMQDKLNNAFKLIENSCPISDPEIDNLDSEFIERATSVVEKFKNTMKEKGTKVVAAGEFPPGHVRLYLTDVNDTFISPFSIDLYEADTYITLEIGYGFTKQDEASPNIRIRFVKQSPAGKEEILPEVISVQPGDKFYGKDYCSEKGTTGEITLDLYDSGYLTVLTKTDHFPSSQGQDITSCNIMEQSVTCASGDIDEVIGNPMIEKVEFNCMIFDKTEAYIDVRKGKSFSIKLSYELVEKFFGLVNPLIGEMVEKSGTKEAAWKKLPWAIFPGKP